MRREVCFLETKKPGFKPKLPIGPKVVPFWGSYLENYKVIPKKEGLCVDPHPRYLQAGQRTMHELSERVALRAAVLQTLLSEGRRTAGYQVFHKEQMKTSNPTP